MIRRIRVGINGYGVIGKRVADAVALQDDMEVSGVTFNHFDYRIRVAAEKGYAVYAMSSDGIDAARAGGAHVSGTADDLVSRVDLVVDCSARGNGPANKRIYERAGVKAIFQGGESHDLTGLSFTAQVNYTEALNRQFGRVVSCNTTGICRVIGALHRRGWVKMARVVVMRRGADPWESHRAGVSNTVVPETRVPSHQGIDSRTVIKGLTSRPWWGPGHTI
jgi:glyceraldehyde-3-phosphate dehydrogenase (NAD(P))